MVGIDSTSAIQCLIVEHGQSLRINPIGSYAGKSQGRIDTFLENELIRIISHRKRGRTFSVSVTGFIVFFKKKYAQKIITRLESIQQSIYNVQKTIQIT